ncbi:hypothetical protein WJX73_004147 [Symbiochloris irregularis]|uniref:Uncharacterized protein n=1 Tax=Symbiochloris irregularis TaxID=706552 RepID=A0AAW1PM20_9CHLO
MLVLPSAFTLVGPSVTYSSFCEACAQQDVPSPLGSACTANLLRGTKSSGMSWLVNEYPTPNGQKQLQKSGMLSKDQLYLFFKEGKLLLDRPEVKAKLRSTHEAGGDLEVQIQRLQHLIFEKEGVDGAHGVACLGQVCQNYGQDPNIMKALIDFVNREEEALEEAEMIPEAFEQKQLLKERASVKTQQLMEQMQRLPDNEKEDFVRRQEENCQKLQQAFLDIPKEGDAMSNKERQQFFQTLTRNSIH